jgi:hypothetical protein
MPSWLVDHPTLIDVLLIVIALACAIRWWQGHKDRSLFGVIGAVLVLVVIWLLGLFLPSDAKKIDHALQEMSVGVQTHDVNRIFQHVSEQFEQGSPTFTSTLNKAAFRQRAESIIGNRHVTEVRVWDVKVEEFSPDKRQAKVTFSAKPKGDWSQDVFYRVRAEFVLDPDGQWRLKGFRVFNPYVESETPLTIPGG